VKIVIDYYSYIVIKHDGHVKFNQWSINYSIEKDVPYGANHTGHLICYCSVWWATRDVTRTIAIEQQLSFPPQFLGYETF